MIVVLGSKPSEQIAQGVIVMESVCLQCGLPITPDSGKFLAMDAPYNGALHWRCAPHYSYPGEWPHKKPSIAYNPPVTEGQKW